MCDNEVNGTINSLLAPQHNIVIAPETSKLNFPSNSNSYNAKIYTRINFHSNHKKDISYFVLASSE